MPKSNPFESEPPRLQLVGTRLAPPVELARWLLEVRRIPYAEVSHAPVFHVLSSRRQGVGIELPLLITPEGPVGGIKDFLNAIDEKCRNGESVLGSDDATRQRTWALINRCYDELFWPAVQTFYFHVLDHGSVVRKYATAGAPWWERLLVTGLYRVWKGFMRKGLSLAEFDAARGAESIRGVFDHVASIVGLGQPFLAGERAGTPDIVFASLASPLLLPPGFGAAVPKLDEIPASLKEVVEDFRNHPAGRFALQLYESHRPAPQPLRSIPRQRIHPLGWLSSPATIRFGVRMLVRFKPQLALGRRLIVSRWNDVREVLERDGDFSIEPINKQRIEAVSGPFILGMDRSPELFAQRESVYGALHAADRQPFLRVLETEPQRLLCHAAERHQAIDVVNGYARLVAARSAAALFGIQGPTEQDLIRVVRAVFHETFLNVSKDSTVKQRGVAAGTELSEWIRSEIQSRVDRKDFGSDVLGCLASRTEGLGGAESARWMAAGLLVGAIDTTASCVNNIVAEVISDARLEDAMRRDLDNESRFLGWCWEALRRRPHNPAVLRETLSDTVLGSRKIPAGTQLLVLTLGAMYDPSAFPSPLRMDPERPLKRYMHFGYGLHQCSGRDLNAIQIPAMVRALLHYRIGKKSPVRNHGPFPDVFVVSLQE